MKCAIMQPYFFPYFGYFQLIYAVDVFVVFDDVNYIKGGWVNRNRLQISEHEQFFSLPLHHASPNRLINQLRVNQQQTKHWLNKLQKSIRQSYSKNTVATEQMINILKNVTHNKEFLIDVLLDSIERVAELLSINNTRIILSSEYFSSIKSKGADRVRDICSDLEADTYINVIGGKDLYNAKFFRERNIKLKFIESTVSHSIRDFQLSILHSMMVKPREVQEKLQCYHLV